MPRVRRERDFFAVETFEGEGVSGHTAHPGCAGRRGGETCQGNGSENDKISAVDHGATITCGSPAACAKFREKKSPLGVAGGGPGTDDNPWRDRTGGCGW